MSDELSKVIKKLVAQLNIEAISTKDLATELTSLYERVERLEESLKREQVSKDSLRVALEKLAQELSEYKKTYVDSAEKIKIERAAFERDKWEFEHVQVALFEQERAYTLREASQLKEILKALLAAKVTSESMSTSMQYGSGGQQVPCPSSSKTETLVKPNL